MKIIVLIYQQYESIKYIYENAFTFLSGKYIDMFIILYIKLITVFYVGINVN